MSAERERDLVRPSVAAAVTIAVVAVLYARIVDAPFVSDDRALVLDGSLARAAHPLADYFAAFWVRTYFRPVTMLSYRLDYLVSADNPAGYHLTNLALHLLDVGLLFAWVRRLGARTVAAAVVALLFGIHPCASETVCWVSARSDSVALAGALGALLLWPDLEDDRGWRAWAASGALLLGLLAKEVALAAAVAILLSDVMQGGLRAIRARRALPLGWAIATYVALRWRALHGVAAIEVARAPQPWLTLAAIGDYARIFFRLHPANVIGRPTDVSAAGVVTGVIVVVLVGGAGAALALRSDRARACALAFGVCALAPVVHVIRFPSHTLVADRYLYVPTAAIAALAALGWSHLGGPGRKALALLVVPLGLWMGLVTWARVDDWRDEVRFWAVTARDAPADDAMPVTNLAVSLARAQRCDLAIDLVRPIATTGPYAASPPDVAIAEQNLVACLSATGAHDEALAFARDALERSPARPSTLRTLGVTAMSAQRFALARGALQRWVKVDPSSADARAWLDLARQAEVAFASQEVQTGGSVARAVWLQRIGADHDAEQAWRALLASTALTPEAVRAAAGYLVERGSVEAARAAIDRVDPSSGDAAALRDALAERVRVERQIDASTALISELARRASR